MAPIELGDLATVSARFASALRRAGLAVGPDRAERLTRAVVQLEPTSTQRLYWCAVATLTDDPGQREVLDPVFRVVLEGLTGVAEFRGQSRGDTSPPAPRPAPRSSPTDFAGSDSRRAGGSAAFA